VFTYFCFEFLDVPLFTVCV